MKVISTNRNSRPVRYLGVGACILIAGILTAIAVLVLPSTHPTMEKSSTHFRRLESLDTDPQPELQEELVSDPAMSGNSSKDSNGEVELFSDFQSESGVEFLESENGVITAEAQVKFIWFTTSFLLKQLTKGAVQTVGSSLTGWAMNAVFGTYDTQEELEEIKGMLEEQTQMLHDIQGTLIDIQNQLDTMLEEILSAIEDEGDKIRFEGWRQTLNHAIGQLNGLSEWLYLTTLSEPGSHNQNDVEKLRSVCYSCVDILIV